MCFNETLSKQTAVCRLWTPELLYTCNKTIKSGFHKTNETPLPFLKKFPPSPNRSVWTFPTEGATLIEQTCGGGSVCSKVRKFLTTTKIVFVQQITVVFLMYSQTIPRMLSLVFQHQLQGLTKHAINIVIKKSSNMVPPISAIQGHWTWCSTNYIYCCH